MDNKLEELKEIQNTSQKEIETLTKEIKNLREAIKNKMIEQFNKTEGNDPNTEKFCLMRIIGTDDTFKINLSKEQLDKIWDILSDEQMGKISIYLSSQNDRPTWF